MSELAGRNTLLGPVKRRYHEADIENYGRIRCQSLTHFEAKALSCYGRDGFDSGKFEDRKVITISLCLVDQDGKRLFSDADVDSISEQDAALVDAIYEVCESHINGDMVTAKNLSETSNGDSQSASLIGAAG